MLVQCYASVPDWKYSIFTATEKVVSQFESYNLIEVFFVPVIESLYNRYPHATDGGKGQPQTNNQY